MYHNPSYKVYPSRYPRKPSIFPKTLLTQWYLPLPSYQVYPSRFPRKPHWFCSHPKVLPLPCWFHAGCGRLEPRELWCHLFHLKIIVCLTILVYVLISFLWWLSKTNLIVRCKYVLFLVVTSIWNFYLKLKVMVWPCKFTHNIHVCIWKQIIIMILNRWLRS